MQVVHNKCDELIPPLSQKTIGRIRVTVHAWKNRNKVESALRDLKHNVDQCYTMFMVSPPFYLQSYIYCKFNISQSRCLES